MCNVKSENNLWFFSDFNGTFDTLNNIQIQELFIYLNKIRKMNAFDKIHFAFVSNNKCDFLQKEINKLNDFVNLPSTIIPDKNKIIFSTVLGKDGYIISPCNNNQYFVNKPSFSKAQQIYNILACNYKSSKEFIYADDCANINIQLLLSYFKQGRISHINNCTFLGTSRSELKTVQKSKLPNFTYILGNRKNFILDGLQDYINQRTNNSNDCLEIN